ncbi:ATP-binding protein [Halobaculum sp. CBA1158]|uniref:histidine kinase N-terminal 7TM domain-containing protein n=1 Tax=Halobaculum sp. CBA1158 TaxID=2904243 RepID=UPI001F3444DD|nr:histidine kinase N-terminal 7TM domain-containing protein [Halobaculum sp. CBA1158]UIO99651.1 ATP-binding protein [Halobaculum sp. CBA1158]
MHVLASGTLVAVMLVTIAVGTTAALLAWRERPEQGAVPLAAMLAGQVWWSVFFVFEIRASTYAGKVFYSDIQWVGVVVIPVAWFLFAMEYTGRDQYVRPRYVALLLAIPAVTVALAFTQNAHDLLYLETTLVTEDGVRLLRRTGGPWYWIVTGYTYLLGLLGSIPLLGLVNSDAVPFRGQSLGLLVGTVAPWASNALFLLGVMPTPGLDPTPVFFAISGVAYLGALTRFRLLGTSPSPNHRARRLVFERMREGAVVVDRHGYVVDMNEQAADVLGVDPDDALGRPADGVIPRYDRLPAEGHSTRHLTVDAGTASRQYDATVTAIEDFHDRPLGRVISFHDVSDHLRQQQRLEVLNRVLRHNIRTETNLIYGHADLMSAADDRVDAVKEGALRIEEISDKARDVIDIFERGRRQGESVPLEPVLRECAERVHERFPAVDAEVTVDAGDAAVSPVVTAVFENLVENAAEHNTADDPRVRVRATRVSVDGGRDDGDRPEGSAPDRSRGDPRGVADGERVRVRVVDNGPGIDDHERAVLDRGNETALEHGSGLGLWLVVWGTDMAGGEVRFEDREGGGTAVTVEVPVVDEGDGGGGGDGADSSGDGGGSVDRERHGGGDRRDHEA